MDRRYHGQDTSSAMHSTVPDGVVIADAKDAGDPFGLSQSYGETFPRIKSTEALVTAEQGTDRRLPCALCCARSHSGSG